MRYEAGHKEEVRKKIVGAASRAFRKSGLAGVSIPALMKKVGLTHGGFYAHFDDRDSLVAEAVREAAAGTACGVFARELSLEETLRSYLSSEHLAHPEEGCVVAALGTDATHQSAPIRSAFADVARRLLQLVENKLHPERNARTVSDEALRLTSTMVGAVVLARLVDDEKLADRILRAARNHP